MVWGVGNLAGRRWPHGSIGGADVVLGADGVHGAARKDALGSACCALYLEYTGAATDRGVVPMERALRGSAQRSSNICTATPGWAWPRLYI